MEQLTIHYKTLQTRMENFYQQNITSGDNRYIHREPMELFVAFRGREPTIDALLRHSGIAA